MKVFTCISVPKALFGALFTVLFIFSLNEGISQTSCPNLVTNGDFEAATSTGFTSGLPVNCGCVLNTQCVTTNFNVKCPSVYPNYPDHTTGTGKFLLALCVSAVDVWTTNVAVTPGTPYTFSFWATRGPFYPINIAMMVNGVNVNQILLSQTTPQWTQYTFSGVCPAGVTSLPIAIRLITSGESFSLGIDDVSFTSCPSANISCTCPRGMVAGPNLIDNGDFSGGNNGFISDNTYITPNSPMAPGRYSVANSTQLSGSSSLWACIGNTTMTTLDPFLVCDGSTTAGRAAWRSQTLSTVAGENYVICFDANNLIAPPRDFADPILEIWVKHGTAAPTLLVGGLTLPEVTDAWVHIERYLLALSNSVIVEIRTASTAIEGNDFALDNIRLNTCAAACTTPDLSATNPTPLCAPATFNLTSLNVTDAANVTNPLTYYATAAAATAGTPALSSTIVSTSGQYWIRKNGTTSACFDTVSIFVAINPKPVYQDLTLSICAGQSVNLTALLTNYSGILLAQWSSGGIVVRDPNNVTPSVSTTFTLIGQNTFGCKDTALLVVTVNPKPNIADSSRTVCPGVPVNLTNLVVNYGAIQNPQWFLGSISGSLVTNPTNVTPSVNSTYFLIGGNTSGCKDTAEIEVIIYCDSIFKGSVLPCGITPRYLSSLSRQGNTRGARTPVPSFPTTAIEHCGKFDIYYEDRIPGTTPVPEGFDNATYGLDRRTTLCAVLTYVQSVFDFSNVHANAPPIRLHVVQSHVPTYNPAPAGASFLAMAGPHFDNTNPNPQIIKGFVYDYTQSGVDPAVGQYHAELIVNFDQTFYGSTAYPINWHNSTGQFGANCQYDLYSVLLHEIGHTLGWISYTNHDINHLPKSILAPNYNHFSGIDSLLYKGTVSSTTGPTTPLLVGGFGNKSINPTLLSSNNALISKDFWITPNAAPDNHPVYSGYYVYPNSFAEGSILSHLDDQMLTYTVRSRVSPGDIEDYVMGPFAASGMYRRVLRDIEINTLGRLGYTINPAISTTPKYLNHPPYSKRMAGYTNFNSKVFSETVLADYTLLNSGATPSVVINLSTIQASALDLVDADGDAISVEPNSLLNIRGCGSGGNNHLGLTLSSNNRIITYTPRPNFFGRAQFGFRLFDGKEAGSYIIYTIDVQKGTNNTNTVSLNLILNGNFEEGSELRRLGADEILDNAQQRQYHNREGKLGGGINFSDSHPYSWASNNWTPYGAGIHVTDTWIQCNGTLDKSGTGSFTSSGGVFFTSPPTIPLVGQRYKTLGANSINYFPLVPDVKKCSRYTLEFDYFANPPDFPNGTNIPLTVGFTNNPTYPALPNLNFSYNYNFPVINGSWQHISIPFTYCGTLPSDYLNLSGPIDSRYLYFNIDNLDLREDLSPYPLTVGIIGSSPSLCPGQSMTLTGTATNTLCNTTYSWSNNGGTNPITSVSPVTTTTYNLTVNDGCRTVTQPFTVVVDPASCTDTCKAAFTYVFTHSCGNVVFTNQSTGVAPLSYLWDFGDGMTSTAQNPSHQFNSCSSFNVCLTITAANGCTKRICQLVQVTNNVPPIITCPANTTVQCGVTTPSVTGTATATDDCLTAPTIAYTDVVTGTLPCNASIQRTWTATDACSNTATCIQTILVRDNIAPTITCPQNLTVNTITGQCYYTFPTLPAVNAMDNCDPTPSVTYSYINSLGITLPFTTATQFPKGINFLTITAKDACNNVSQACNFTLTVVDNEKPKIICPLSISVVGSITPPSTLCKAIVNGLAPTVTDNCPMTTTTYSISPSGNATPSSGSNDASGTNFTGTSTVTYNVKDMAGNTASCAFNVVVTCEPCTANAGPDVAICPGVCTTLTAVGGPNYAWNTGSTTASITVCPLVTTTYTVTVTKNGCTATDQVLVVVNPKPVISDGSTTVCAGTSVNLNSLVSVINGPIVSPIWHIGSITGTVVTPPVTPSVTTTYFVEGANSFGCRDTARVLVTIISCVDPCHASFNFATSGSCSNIQFTNQSDGTLPLIYSWNFGDSGSGVNNTSSLQNPSHQFTGCGTYNVCLYLLAADGCRDTVCRQITIDNVLPVLTCPANITVTCTRDTTPSVTGTATATDNCSTVTLSHSDVVTGTMPCNASIRRTWTARDACGNIATCIQTILVRDNIAPTLTCPQNFTVNTNAGQCYYTFPTLPAVNAMDNCDLTPSVNYWYINTTTGVAFPFTTATQFPKGINILVITAKDACNNVSQECAFTLTVVDNQKPTITCPLSISVVGSITPPSTLCKAIVNGLTPTVTDNCPMTTTTYSISPASNATPSSGNNDASGTNFMGTSTVTYTATDMAGNTASCSFNVNVSCDTCQCGSFSNLNFRPIFDWSKTTFKCGDTITNPCIGAFNPTIEGTFTCSGTNCSTSSPISWQLYRLSDNTLVATGNTTRPNFIFSLSPIYFNTIGMYELTMTGQCGITSCPPCKLKIYVGPCPPLNTCSLVRDCNSGNLAWQTLSSTAFVKDMVVYNNKLIATGNFTIGSATNIAQWDGSNWSNLGTGAVGGTCLAVHNNKLYVGGGSLSYWDGINWTSVSLPSGSIIYSMLSTPAGLVVAGKFTIPTTTPAANNIALWNGSTWSNPYGAGLTGTSVQVNGLGLYNGNVVAGGVFSTSGSNTSLNNIAYWDGTLWQPFSNGIILDPSNNGQGVTAIFQLNNDLIVGGRFQNAANSSGVVNNTKAIAKWNNGWSSMNNGVITTYEGIYDLEFFNGILYAGGYFTGIGSNLATNGVAYWNGTDWISTNHGNRLVLALEKYAPNGNSCELYSGGEVFLNRLACTTPTDETTYKNFHIIPNPNNGTFIVELPEAAKSGLKFRITDVTGRVIQEYQTEMGNSQQTVKANNLASGLYFLQVVSEGKILAAEKFVKQ